MRAPGAPPKSARVGYSTCALGVAVGERDHRAARRHALDGGAERRSADALGDHVETPGPQASARGRPRRRRARRDRARARAWRETAVTCAPPMWRAARRSARRRRSRPSPARVALIRLPPMSRAQQGGDAGDRERRGLREAHLVGKDRHACVGYGCARAHALVRASATTRAPSGGPLPSAAWRPDGPGEVPAGQGAGRLARSARGPRRG